MSLKRKRRASFVLLGALGISGCRFSYEVTPTSDDAPSLDGTGGTPGGAPGSGGADTGGTPSGGASNGGQGGEAASGGSGTGGTESLPDDWWDGAFRTRVRIDIDNAGMSTALSDFPIALPLSGGAFEAAKAGDTGDALRLVSDDHTTELPYEIEMGATLQESTLRIRIPEIAADPGSSTLWLYYDNPDATSGEQPALVWSNGFVGVYHFNGDLNDSTSFMHDGTGAATPSSGQLAGGYEFDTASTPVNLATPVDLANIFEGGGTISGWINPQSGGNSLYPRIMDKSSGTTGQEGWALQFGSFSNRLHFEHDFSTEFGQWRSPENAIVLSTWQSFSVSFDSSEMLTPPKFYLDGATQVVETEQAPNGTLPDDTNRPLSIGDRSGNSDRSFDGFMDEVRISTVVRSADWVMMEHRCMSSGCASISSTVDTLD